jgi:hypothetical protein
MAIYSVNQPVKTVTIHKNDCYKIPRKDLKNCGCGETGTQGNQKWFCEEHVSVQEIDDFENGRHWATLFCDVCFNSDR